MLKYVFLHADKRYTGRWWLAWRLTTWQQQCLRRLAMSSSQLMACACLRTAVLLLPCLQIRSQSASTATSTLSICMRGSSKAGASRRA